MKLAQFTTQLTNTATGAYGTAAAVPKTSFSQVVGDIIGVALSFLGVIFLVLIIYAGFLWMTAQGNPKTVEKAKEILNNAIIGLVILVTAGVISMFVIDSVLE